jgi:hypothetical protein
MDVDDEADLRALLEYGLDNTETGAWLRASGVLHRLQLGSTTGASVAAKI